MRPEQLYQNLKDLADKLGITVLEHNLRTAGVRVQSGLCILKGKQHFIMDKHKSIYKKIEILASCLCEIPHEDIYIVPAVREFLKKYSRDD